MLGALASGRTVINRYAPGRDCQSTLDCLGMLGIPIHRQNDTVSVEGRGFSGLSEPEDIMNAGNSGTTMRLLAGILAGQSFYSVITGDTSLRSRPMKRVTEPLTQMGASIWGRGGGSLAPLSIRGGPLRPTAHRPEVASAQVKSALLLAGLHAPGETSVEEPNPTRDHTERLLEYFGCTVVRQGNLIRLRGQQRLEARNVEVPGDISSAAFFLAAATIVPGSDVLIEDVGMNPTRSGMLDVLSSMGASIEIHRKPSLGPEPIADLRVRACSLRATTIGDRLIPAVIDEIPVLAVLATQARGLTLITGAQELRHKESDRLKAIAENLNLMGAEVRELTDGLQVKGPTRLRGGPANASGDHRIAMALSVAALVASEPVELQDPECIDVSYPGFLKALKALEGNHDE